MCIVRTSVLAACTMVGTAAAAQQSPEPFKVGTLSLGGRSFVGVVVRDSLVIDLNAANAAVRTPRPPLVLWTA